MRPFGKISRGGDAVGNRFSKSPQSVFGTFFRRAARRKTVEVFAHLLHVHPHDTIQCTGIEQHLFEKSSIMPPRYLLSLFALVVVLPTPVVAQYINLPSKQVLKNTPGLSHHTLGSKAMGRKVGYNVILPAGYEKGNARHPVVYWLHGGGGNESSNLYIAKTWRETYTAKPAPILVFPAAFRSGYMDHHDGKTMVESMIIRELIPHIDKTYRTIAKREGRAAHGFSMGSSGCLKFAAKYPHMFCAAVAYGGGAVDLENTRSPWLLNILKRNLNADPKRIRQNNTYHFIKKNGKAVREADIRFLLICGRKDSWAKSAKDFHAYLKSHKIPSKLTLVPKVGHNFRLLHKAEGDAAVKFQMAVFRRK